MRRLFWIAAVLLLCLAMLLVFKRRPATLAPEIPPDTLLLAYPLKQGGWLTLQRAAADLPDLPEEKVQRIVRELAQTDSNPSVFSPLPETFPLRSVYVDGSRLYMDMSSSALEELSGGSQEEIILLESLRRTLAWNLPNVDQLQILVDGLPRRTLAASGEDGGHVNVLNPILLLKK